MISRYDFQGNSLPIPSKRPRRVITPNSAAISVITPDNRSTTSQPPPVPPPIAAPSLVHSTPLQPAPLTQPLPTRFNSQPTPSSTRPPSKSLFSAVSTVSNTTFNPPYVCCFRQSALTQPPPPPPPRPPPLPPPPPAPQLAPVPHPHIPSLLQALPAPVVKSNPGIPFTNTTFAYTARDYSLSNPPAPLPLQGYPFITPASSADPFLGRHRRTVSWTNQQLVEVLSRDLEAMCLRNASTPTQLSLDTYHSFFSQNKQPFDLSFYVNRLVQYANCSPAAFVVMLVYVDRVKERLPALFVTDMNCHRVVLTALVLAIKFVDDEVFSNAHYSRVGGVTTAELNDLELKFLEALNWTLAVSPDMYTLYEDGLLRIPSHAGHALHLPL